MKKRAPDEVRGPRQSNRAPERSKQEAALQESQKRLSQIVQGLPIAAFVIDDAHIVTHCNRALENLTGISASELVGTRDQWKTFYPSKRPTLADLIVDQAPEELIARYYPGKYRKSVVIEGGYEVEDFFPRAGEAGKWLFFTAAPLKDDSGKATGAIETIQDIHDRKHAEQGLRQSERRLRALLNFAPYPIVVFTLDGRVSFFNPAFSRIFGWSLEELEGKRIPYVPADQKEKTVEGIRRLLKEKVITGFETQRLTKDGRVLDVVLRAATFTETEDEPAGIIVILRNVTQEKRMTRINEVLLGISTALPEYPDLQGLLYYINSEVKRLLDTEGALVVLHDEVRGELFMLGAAYDDMATEKRVREIRFPKDQLVSGQVISTGRPVIISDTSIHPHLYEERDRKLGYKTRNLVVVPLKSSDRIIGTLCAINKKEGLFDQTDVEMLSLIAGTVALSVENASVTEELKTAYKEVTGLNRAKDKAINHLAHELKTPAAILTSSLDLLVKKIAVLPDSAWKPIVDRIKRNLERILEIQYEVNDIMEEKQSKAYGLLSLLLDQCADELEILIAEQADKATIIESVRKRIEDLFGPREAVSKEIDLGQTVLDRLKALKPNFSHRQVDVVTGIDATPLIHVPVEVLQKVVDGLVKNAVENTPDEGKIEVNVFKRKGGALLEVHDYGVGLTAEAQKRIFEGFFTTRDTLAYSTRKPFDFNAGGKGADLLRMKIFSERYHFQIGVTSERCQSIPLNTDVCPGKISQCRHCNQGADCHRSGGTTFSVYFPPANSRGS